jgi:hypothetical protein
MSVPSYVVRGIATPRTFVSVRQAVMVYVSQKAKRGLRSMYQDCKGWDPIDQSVREIGSATYAALCVCIESEHLPCDIDQDFGLFPRRVADLADWYLSSAEHGQQELADDLGMSTADTIKYCRYTEQILRRRLRNRGLLVETT